MRMPVLVFSQETSEVGLRPDFAINILFCFCRSTVFFLIMCSSRVKSRKCSCSPSNKKVEYIIFRTQLK